MRQLIAITFCSLCACTSTSQPPKGGEIPPELIPAGYSAADCHFERPGEVMTEAGVGTIPVATGERGASVKCEKNTPGPLRTITTPICRTKAGKELPLGDCCMTEAGDTIPNCQLKPQPAEE